MPAFYGWAAHAAFVAAALVVAATGFRDLQRSPSSGQGPGAQLGDVVTAAVRSRKVDEGLKALLLGGLLADPGQGPCVSKCNGAEFDGGACQGKMVTKCDVMIIIDDISTIMGNVNQKCLGTFTASDDGQIDCVGLFSRNDDFAVFMEEGIVAQMTNLLCGVEYNARVAYTESPFAYHMEESCTGATKYKKGDGFSETPTSWSGFWEEMAASYDLIEWSGSWNDDYFGMEAEPRGHGSNERDCSQGCLDSFPAPTCNGVPSDLSAECSGLFNFSYSEWASTTTKLCEGHRTPMGAFVDDKLHVYSTCNGTATRQQSYNTQCGIVVNDEQVCKGALFKEVIDKDVNGDIPFHLMGEVGFCDGPQTTVTDITAPGDGTNGEELEKKTVVVTV